MCLNACSILLVVVPPAIEGMPVDAPPAAPRTRKGDRKTRLAGIFDLAGGSTEVVLHQDRDIKAVPELADILNRSSRNALLELDGKGLIEYMRVPGRKTQEYRLTALGAETVIAARNATL